MTTNMTNVLWNNVTKMENLTFNNTEDHLTNDVCPNSSNRENEFLEKFIHSLIIIICIPGIIGNGIVIRYLSLHIKRHPFTIYIFNLAVADSGTLIFLFLGRILILSAKNISSLIIIRFCFICTYCTGQFFLATISIDRCLALFFPIWYRCHRPRNLSTRLCVFSWIASSLLCAIHCIPFFILVHVEMSPINLILTYNLVCIPLFVISSLALFIKGYLKSQMRRRGNLLIAVLLALFFFLLFSIPLSTVYLSFIVKKSCTNLIKYGDLCACLNSSVNPLIYFLLGRNKERQSRCSLKTILQTVFKEEDQSEEQPEAQVDI